MDDRRDLRQIGYLRQLTGDQFRKQTADNSIIIADDKLDSLKRFKDDVKEVAQDFECGIGLEKFSDLKEGDVFEAFIIEEYKD